MVKAGFKQTEIGLIPEDWEVLNIGELTSKILGGGTPSRNIKEYWNGNIPWMTVKDFSTFNPYQTQEYITDIGLQNSSTRLVKSNDLIIATRIALGQIVKYNVDVTINQDLKTLQLNSNVDKDYFIYSFRNLSNKIIEKGSGSTVLGLSIDDLKSFKIPFPPLPEQTAIAEALSDADAWIESLEQLIAKKRLLKQGAMQTLLTPKEDWEVKKLGEMIILAKSGGTPLSSNKDFYDGNIPFLSISDMTEQGKYLTKTTNSISQKGVENSASWIVPTNSLIYSMYASVGFVSINKIELATSQAVLNIIFKKEYDLEFMYYKLSSMQSEVMMYVGEGTQKNLNAQTVKGFDIKFPKSKEEQTRIATILSDMDAELEALEAQLQKAKQMKQGMMQELLTGRVRLV